MPSAEVARSAPLAVLAVLVVFQRGLDRVEAWPAVVAAMERPTAASGALFLQRVLIYDNSPTPRIDPTRLPAWCDYRHDAGNGGTAAAYAAALGEAAARTIPWLLLLDHDTSLPGDLLRRADHALAAARCIPAAVLPRVRHGTAPISPSRITWAGSIRPLAADEAPAADDRLTGIASGALLRVDALRQIEAMPATLWLDYVDHWLFIRLGEAGHRLAVSEAVLRHDLSILDPRSVSDRRLASILDGEDALVRSLPWPARLLQPLRLLVRAIRLTPVVPAHAGAILKHLLYRVRSTTR